MHFNDAVKLYLQKPDIIEYYNQTNSGVDTVEQMIGTYNVDKKTRRWSIVIFYIIMTTPGINTQTICTLKSYVKIS